MIFLALRSLYRHYSRTILATAAISIACALVLDMQMLSHGFERSLGSILARSGYQLRIFPRGASPLAGDLLNGGEKIAKSIRKIPHVADTIPLLITYAMLKSSKGTWMPVEAFGFEKTAEVPFYHLLFGDDFIPTSNQVVINDRLSGYEKLSIRQTISLLGDISSFSIENLPMRTPIVGVAKFDIEANNDHIVAMSLNHLQALKNLKQKDSISLIVTKVDNNQFVLQVSSRIDTLFPDLQSYDIIDFANTITKPLLSLNLFSSIIRTVALGMSFLFLSVFLVYVVYESIGELSTLRVIGFTPQRIFLYILMQGLLLGLMGFLLGSLLGISFSKVLDHLLRGFGEIPDTVKFFIPSHASFYWTLLFMLFSSFFSSIIPAYWASKVDLVEYLHQEFEQ